MVYFHTSLTLISLGHTDLFRTLLAFIHWQVEFWTNRTQDNKGMYQYIYMY